MNTIHGVLQATIAMRVWFDMPRLGMGEGILTRSRLRTLLTGSSMTRDFALNTERCVSIMGGLVLARTVATTVGQGGGDRTDKRLCSRSSTGTNVTGRQSRKTCSEGIDILCARCVRRTNCSGLMTEVSLRTTVTD